MVILGVCDEVPLRNGIGALLRVEEGFGERVVLDLQGGHLFNTKVHQSNNLSRSNKLPTRKANPIAKPKFWRFRGSD